MFYCWGHKSPLIVGFTYRPHCSLDWFSEAIWNTWIECCFSVYQLELVAYLWSHAVRDASSAYTQSIVIYRLLLCLYICLGVDRIWMITMPVNVSISSFPYWKLSFPKLMTFHSARWVWAHRIGSKWYIIVTSINTPLQ